MTLAAERDYVIQNRRPYAKAVSTQEAVLSWTEAVDKESKSRVSPNRGVEKVDGCPICKIVAGRRIECGRPDLCKNG